MRVLKMIAAYHTGMPSLPVAVLHDHAALAKALREQGACVLRGFPDPASTLALRDALKLLQATGALQPGEVGHGAGQHLRTEIRGDDTDWMRHDSGMAALDYLACLRSLRDALNPLLFLGLDEEEAHFACYPAGASYRRHRDQFHGRDTRVLSLVSYVNEDWLASHGGALRLYLPQGAVELLPHAGTSIVFLSDIEREVLPAMRERLSIAAWLRNRMP